MVRLTRSAGSRGEVGGGGVVSEEERATGAEEKRIRRESRREPSSRRKPQPVFMFTKVSPGRIKTSQGPGDVGREEGEQEGALSGGEEVLASRAVWGNYLKGVF